MAVRFTLLMDDSRDVFEERKHTSDRKQAKKTRQTILNIASGLMGLAPVVMELLKKPSPTFGHVKDDEDDDETPTPIIVGKPVGPPKPAEAPSVELPVESYSSFKEGMDRRQKAMDALFKLPLSASSAAELFMAFCRLSYSDRADVFDFLTHAPKADILSALLGTGMDPKIIAELAGLVVPGSSEPTDEAEDESSWGSIGSSFDARPTTDCPDCGGNFVERKCCRDHHEGGAVACECPSSPTCAITLAAEEAAKHGFVADAPFAQAVNASAERSKKKKH